MRRVEHMPGGRLRIAVVMLVALLLVSLQQQAIQSLLSAPVKKAAEAAKQLSLKQGADTASPEGVVKDTHPAFAVLLACSLLLALFPAVRGLRVTAAAPSILSRNSCCIVPKGP